MKLNEQTALALDDVLIVPQYSTLSSRSECSTTTRIGKLELGVPVLSAAMDTVTGDKFCLALAKEGGMAIVHRFQAWPEQSAIVAAGRRGGLAAAAIGIHDYEERARNLVMAGVSALVFDVAHCDTLPAYKAIEKVRKEYPDLTILAGTVATADAAKRLVEAGVNGVRVGVGTGGACLTRTVAGVGLPQFTALVAAAEVCRPHEVAVLADGGIRTPGDFSKAIGAGASAVVVGKLFAETVEAAGPVVAGKRKYYGMATKKAAKFSRPDGTPLPAEEGTTVVVDVTRTVEDVVADLAGGLRSAMSYSGARSIPEYWDRVRFQRISSAARYEGNKGVS